MEKYLAKSDEDSNDKFTIDVVDVRQLKRSQKSKEINQNPWVFLIQDQNDDVRIKECLSEKDNEPSLQILSLEDKLSKIKEIRKLIPTPK